MTEQEYIDTTNLAKVRCLLAVLRTLIPQDEGKLPREEYTQLARVAYEWEERLTEVVKTKD